MTKEKMDIMIREVAFWYNRTEQDVKQMYLACFIAKWNNIKEVVGYDS